MLDCCRYDVEAMRQVRQFKGHKDRITELVVSQDAKWLLSSSMDGTVRIWDIPAAACLQVWHTPAICPMVKAWHRWLSKLVVFPPLLPCSDSWHSVVGAALVWVPCVLLSLSLKSISSGFVLASQLNVVFCLLTKDWSCVPTSTPP